MHDNAASSQEPTWNGQSLPIHDNAASGANSATAIYAIAVAACGHSNYEMQSPASPYNTESNLAVHRRNRPCRTTQETRVAVPLNSKLGVVDFRRRCCRSHVSEIVSLGNLIVHLCCPRRTPTKSFTSSGPKGFEPMSETLSFVSMPRTLIDPSISHSLG